jgi:DNA-binding NtrC family response regulator
VEEVAAVTSMSSIAPDANRITVLFVDDEPSILRSIRRTLVDAPIEVLTAFDGNEAVAVLDSRRVDVLVSDIDMHGMTGLELVAHARRTHPTTLRMLLSGQSTLHRALQAINEGEVVRFFPKPFDPGVFRTTIESLAGRIVQMRRDGEDQAQAARRKELHRWMEARFPGSTTVERAEGGEVRVDAASVRARLEKTNASSLLQLLRR